MSQSNPAGLCPVTHCGVLCFTLSWTEVVELLHQVQMGVLPPYSIIRKHLFKKKKCFPCWVSCNLSMTVAQNRIWQLSPNWHRSNMTYIRFMDVSFLNFISPHDTNLPVVEIYENNPIIMQLVEFVYPPKIVWG